MSEKIRCKVFSVIETYDQKYHNNMAYISERQQLTNEQIKLMILFKVTNYRTMLTWKS